MILDEDLAYVCGFDRLLSPLGERSFPPAVLSAARRVSGEGRLPPRVPVVSAEAGIHIVSVLGDQVSVHAAAAAPPGHSEARAAAAVLREFEADHGTAVAAVSGDLTRLVQARGSVRRGLQRPTESITLASPPEVFIHWKLGTLGGRVTAEMNFHNVTTRPLAGVAAPLKATGDFLRPIAVFGQEVELFGMEVRLLSPLEPGSRTVVVHFEPQQARVGLLTGEVTFRDRGEAPRKTAARPLRVDASLRPLGPPVLRRPAEAAYAVERDARVGDAWRFSWPAVVSEAFAFERAKEAVARDRCLRLLEVTLEDPMVFEAWYVGEFPKAGRGVVVEVCAWGDSRLLDVRVGASAEADLVGALAEYRRRVRELLSERFMGVQVTAAARPVPASRRGAPPPALHAPLLLRQMTGRASAPQIAGALAGQRAWDRYAGVDLVSEWEEVMDDEQEQPAHLQPGRKAPDVPSGAPAESDYEFLPGLLAAYHRVLAPEVRARAKALKKERTRGSQRASH